MGKLQEVFIILAWALAASLAVLAWRRLGLGRRLDLEQGSTFVTNTYPIVGLIYGVFLGFTIVITWGHFLDAESSATQEVTRLSEIWRDVGMLRDPFRAELRCLVYDYTVEVIATDWQSLESGAHSPESTEVYEDIWRSFANFTPDSLAPRESVFYGELVGQLNELGRERRRREYFATAVVHPTIRTFLIGGGFLVVLFSLLLPAPNFRVQLGVTALVTCLIAASIVLSLGLERPFNGNLSVRPTAFKTLKTSLEGRPDAPLCSQPSQG